MLDRKHRILPPMRAVPIYATTSYVFRDSAQAAEKLYRARQTVAVWIGADKKEITFTQGGSEADNQAVLSAAQAGQEEIGVKAMNIDLLSLSAHKFHGPRGAGERKTCPLLPAWQRLFSKHAAA